MNSSRKKFNFLVIEDNPGDYLLVEICLLEKFPAAVISNAKSYNEALVLTSDRANKPDLIFLDLGLPDNSGEALISGIMGLNLEIPIIVLTGYSDFEFALKTLTLGASDYLLKDEINPTILAKCIFYSLERAKQYVKLKHSQDDFQSLFYLSPTGMWIIDFETFAVIDINIAALQIFGYFKDIFLTKSLNDILPAPELEIFKNSFSNDFDHSSADFTTTYKYNRENGGIADLEIKTRMIEYRGKKAILILTNDITERLIQFNEIKAQNKKLSDIAWLQSHIIRAPLSRILGLCQLIETFEEFRKNKDLGQMIKYLSKSASDLDQAIRKIITKSTTSNDFKSDFDTNIES